MADGIRELFGPGSGGGHGAGHAVGTLAGVAGNVKKYYSWVADPEASLPPLAPDNLYGASDGIAHLLDGAINFVIDHIHPLLELLDYVTGDSEALKVAAQAWHAQGTGLNDVIRELKASVGDLPEEWAGDASAQFGGFMADVTRSLSELAGAMGQTQHILDQAREESEFARSTIVMIIREVIEWFALYAAIDLATAGAATVFEAAGTAAFLGKKVEDAEQAASRLAHVYLALQKIVQSLQDAKNAYKTAKGLDRLKKLYSMSKSFDSAFEVGKFRNLRMFGNGKLSTAGRMVFESGRHGPHAKEIKDVIELGKGGVLTTGAMRAGVAGVIGATGVDSEPGAAGLAKGLLSGNVNNLPENAQGAAEAVGLGPPIPEAPPPGRIRAILDGIEPPEEH